MKQIPLLLICFVFAACQKQVSHDSDLPLFSLQEKKSHADSLITGKPLPLNPTRFDTMYLPKQWRSAMTYSTIPYKNQSKVPFKNIDTIWHRSKFDTYTYKPKVVDAKPFQLALSHPKPVKAGDFRSSGLANENITYLSEEQGLPSSQVKCLLEDKFGSIWIGHSAGLTRYDGNYFYNYNGKNGIIGSPSKLKSDPGDSSIWMTTEIGLINFKGNRLTLYNKESGLLSDQVEDFCFDKHGNLWVICMEGGVCKLGKNKIYQYGKETHMPVEVVYTIGVDSSDVVNVGTWDQNISRIINDTIIRVYNPGDHGQFGNGLVSCMYLDKQKRLWFGNYGAGVHLIMDDKTIQYKPETGFPYFIIYRIIQDNKGRMWFATAEGGVARLDKDGYKIYTINQGLSSNKIMDLIEDKTGNIWLATQDGGVNKIVPGSFKIMGAKDGLSDKPIQSVYVNQRKEILFGTWAGGLYAFNGKQFKHFQTGGLNWKIIMGMGEDKEGNLYVGTHQHGFDKLTVSKNDTVPYDSLFHLNGIQHFGNNFGYRIICDHDDAIWTGNINYGGITKQTANYFEFFDESSGLSSAFITGLAEDKDNTIWIAYAGAGISQIKDGKITNYTAKSGLPSNHCQSLFIDSQNNIWIGTVRGLVKYDRKTFITFTINDGMSHNNSLNIIEDPMNRIWVGTSFGLNCLTPDKSKSKGYSIESYNSSDGLKTTQFNANSVAFDKNTNTLWWGTMKGAISLDLNTFNQNASSPRIYLMNVSLMDEDISFHALRDSSSKHVSLYNNDSTICFKGIEFDTIKPYFNAPDELSLPYNINSLTFYFFGLDGQPSTKIKYRCQLEGYDEYWRNSKSTAVKYANLSPGTYTFKAQGKLDGKEWSPGFSYTFTIRPPFWQTWWFRILSFGVLVYSIILIFRYRNRTLIKRQVQLEKTVNERTKEINLQKQLIEVKQKEILDSINYAKRIQYALLAHKEFLDEHLKDYFVFFNPKDIVSGDFYWATKKDGKFYLAVCDSTGHGVPGAFMSLLSIGFLTEAINEKGITKPNEVFSFVRKRIIENVSYEGQKDGFDGILICVDPQNKKITYSAANNNPLLVRNGERIPLNSNRIPVGISEKMNEFELFEFSYEKNDSLYLFTDGFADQFGGPKGKKFKYKQLNELLTELSGKPIEEQRITLKATFDSWKGSLEQIDDVCLLGIKF